MGEHANGTARAAGSPRPNLGITCSGNFFGFEVLTAVEELGYDAFYTGEHFVYDKAIQDALPVLGAAAAGTRRIAIGSAAILAPLYPPVLLAKATSTLDLLSGGRLVVGLGVGGEFPGEFAAFGVPLASRGARTDETIDVVRALWTGKPVVHDGRFFRLDGQAIDPATTQPNGPPIWITGRSEAAMRRAALRGDGYMPYLVSAASYASRGRFIRDTADGAGRTLPADFAWAVRLEMRIDDTDEQALRRTCTALEWRFGKPFDAERAARNSVSGTPQRVLDGLLAYVDAGVDVFALQPVASSAEEMVDLLARFAAEVMPELRTVGRQGRVK
jgi:probable F420-dependent oxidoreductase